MKTITIWLAFFLTIFISTPLFSQFIAIQNGDKIEVRNINGGYLTSGNYSGLKDIAQGDNIIVLWYDSDKIEIRGFDLKFITSAYYFNLKKIGTAQDYMVLYFENGKIELRDKDLRYISSWYQ